MGSEDDSHFYGDKKVHARRPFNPIEVIIFTSEKNVTRVLNMSTLVKFDIIFRMELELLDPTKRKG